MQPSTVKSGRGTKNKRLWGFGAAILTFLILLFLALNFWLKSQMNRTEFTANTQKLEIVIGKDVVRVPANHVRFAHQRDSSTADQLNLVYLFPQTIGYLETQKAAFNAAENDSTLVHITLRKRELSFDMSRRLQPIYTQLFEGASQTGPDGLVMQPLRPGTGYDGEMLAISQNTTKQWVARCQTQESNMRPVCIRDVFVGQELSALYSFPLHMLKDWRRIENTTQEFLKSVIF